MFNGASGPTQLSDTTPIRLVQSTGNLYWSSNPAVIEIRQTSKLQVSAPTIFRAAKSSQPGEEVPLYVEPDPSGETEFWALTFAEVDDEFYGYFVANYEGVSQIKRIPLAGGPAVVLADSPATIGTGDLVTDGSFLCWADSGGIRSMPIGGGPVTTLAAATGFARLSVLGGTLYYIDRGAILGVPMGGGTPSYVVGDRFSGINPPITALYVLAAPPPVALAEPPGPPTVPDVALVWGRADGAVFGLFRGEPATYQEPTADTTVACVYSTGARVLWSDQYTGLEGTRYQVQMSYGGVTTTLSSEKNATLSDRDLLADEVAAYWTDVYVEKNAY
jgi:hypothetical protein